MKRRSDSGEFDPARFRNRARLGRVGRAVFPHPAEVERNPRARSAVLRAAERVAA